MRSGRENTWEKEKLLGELSVIVHHLGTCNIAVLRYKVLPHLLNKQKRRMPVAKPSGHYFSLKHFCPVGTPLNMYAPLRLYLPKSHVFKSSSTFCRPLGCGVIFRRWSLLGQSQSNVCVCRGGGT